MRAMLVISALMLLSACQTPCAAPVGETTRRYRCEDGSTLVVTFSADRARIEQDGYVALNLPVGNTGLGYRYADQGAELVGRPGEMRWRRPGAADTVCRPLSPTAS
jgi:hypothetical protein